jgi:hypothetical protein
MVPAVNQLATSTFASVLSSTPEQTARPTPTPAYQGRVSTAAPALLQLLEQATRVNAPTATLEPIARIVTYTFVFKRHTEFLN